MSIILFVIGSGLLFVGSIRLGTFEAEGPQVRTAGFVLTMPLIAIYVLSFMVRMITNADEGALGFVAFLELPAMAVAVGVAYALLARDRESIATLFQPTQRRTQDKASPPRKPPTFNPPRSRSEDQTDERPTLTPRRPEPRERSSDHPLSGGPKTGDADEATPPEAEEARIADAEKSEQKEDEAPVRPAPRRAPANRKSFPTVMTTAEAASYLNMAEADVLTLIESGKLTAARINYRYRISRSVLDEFIKENQTSEDGE